MCQIFFEIKKEKERICRNICIALHIGGLDMIRTQIYFTKRQKKFFKKESKRLQETSASLIRRVLDQYIDQRDRENRDNGK